MSDEQRAIPLYAITSAAKSAKEHDEFVVIRSDNDYQYARTLDAANTLADEMRPEISVTAPIGHTVQVIQLEGFDDE